MENTGAKGGIKVTVLMANESEHIVKDLNEHLDDGGEIAVTVKVNDTFLSRKFGYGYGVFTFGYGDSDEDADERVKVLICENHISGLPVKPEEFFVGSVTHFYVKEWLDGCKEINFSGEGAKVFITTLKNGI